LKPLAHLKSWKRAAQVLLNSALSLSKWISFLTHFNAPYASVLLWVASLGRANPGRNEFQIDGALVIAEQ